MQTIFKKKKKLEVQYIESKERISDIRLLIPHLKLQGFANLNYIDPVDNWLQKRLNQGLRDTGIQGKQHPSPMFLNSKEELASFFSIEKRNTIKLLFTLNSVKSTIF